MLQSPLRHGSAKGVSDADKRSMLAGACSCRGSFSRKEVLDAPISAWIESFNRRESFVTTGSCSGRIAAVFARAPSEEDSSSSTNAEGEDASPVLREGAGHWLLVTH